MHPSYIRGLGRGNGHWISFGPLQEQAFDILNMKGTWSRILHSLATDPSNPYTVAMIAGKCYQQEHRGRPTMMFWTNDKMARGLFGTSESETESEMDEVEFDNTLDDCNSESEPEPASP